MQENVQGWRFGGQVVDAQFVINWQSRAQRQLVLRSDQKLKKGVLEEYLINGPPIDG